MKTVRVPVGLEKVLYHAAEDAEFKRALLRDREGTIAAHGLKLRESERLIFAHVGDDELARMISRIRAKNPMRRRFMGLVAGAAASLAAGTAVLGCDEVETDYSYADSGGCDGDTDTDTDTGTDTGTDTDTDTNTDTDTAPDGGDPDGGEADAGDDGGAA